MAYTNGPPTIVTDGLVLLLDAMNPRSYVSGSTQWNDVTANNNSGSFTGMGLVSNPTGFQFGTGSSFVTINNTGTLTFTTASQFTLNIWTRFDGAVTSSTTNNSGCAFAAGSFVGSVGIGFGIGRTGLNTHSIGYAARPTGGTDYLVNVSILTGSIYNATMVFSGSVIYAYLNGVFRSSLAVNTGTTFSTNWSMFTNNGIPGGNNFKPEGKMYYASAYSRALSAQEVTQNFNAMRGRFGV